MSTISDTTLEASIAAPAPSATAEKKKAAATALSLLPAFLERYRWGHRDGMHEVVDRMAEALEAQHPTVAAKVRKTQPLKPVDLPLPTGLISFELPSTRFADVVLPDAVADRIPAIVEEHARAAELAAFHLFPRHKILLQGPSGNGKTMLAEAFAGELGIPLLRANYCNLIASHLGETGQNLGKIFAYAHRAPCVLFFDEFDGISFDRTQSTDMGEMKRITNQLLILFDQLPPSCVLMCATNLPEQIDAAVHRRFDFRLSIPAPDFDIRLRCARIELAPTKTPGYDLLQHAEAVANLPFESLAGLVQHCRTIRRDLVLNEGKRLAALTAGIPA